MAIVFRTISRSKYGNKKVQFDGFTFDSNKEFRRYCQLKLMEKAGEIKNLKIHQRYPIYVNGMKVCSYESDFEYIDSCGEKQVEDAKGFRTRDFILKKKLMLAAYNITIQEV